MTIVLPRKFIQPALEWISSKRKLIYSESSFLNNAWVAIRQIHAHLALIFTQMTFHFQ